MPRCMQLGLGQAAGAHLRYVPQKALILRNRLGDQELLTKAWLYDDLQAVSLPLQADGL